MKWIQFPDSRLEVRGLNWFEEDSPRLLRLPSRAKDGVRPPIWDLAQQPSGGRIRFTTDSSALFIRARYHLFVHMENMCRIGQAGLACYVDGRFGRAAFPAAQELESPLFQGRPRSPAAVTVYLPLYHPVELVAFGFDDDASVVAAPPFAVERPVVFYGSSITQGGCASQPGNSYEAMLGRDLNVDFVNLGFSGNGIGEPEVARLVASVDASCFVVDFGVNCPTVEAMRSAYAPFLETIRAAHPEVPMVCASPIFSTPEAWEKEWHGKLDGMRRVAREAVEARAASGDRRVEFVDGLKLIGPEGGDGLVDGVHPNDLGFRMMADGLRPAVSKALGLGAAARHRGRRSS